MPSDHEYKYEILENLPARLREARAKTAMLWNFIVVFLLGCLMTVSRVSRPGFGYTAYLVVISCSRGT